jgi:isopenicillin N synthase-like dioxygenase
MVSQQSTLGRARMSAPSDSAIDIRDTDIPTRALPVMDLGPFFAGEPRALETLAEKWREACEGVGFFCLVNHGLADDEIEKMEAEVRRFHALPADAKMAIKVNEHQRGFIPGKATILTHSTYEKHTKLDTVECLVLASEYDDDDPHVKEGKQFYSKNQWPEGLAGFREAVEGYMARVMDICKRTLPVWALALDLRRDYFAPYFENSYTYFRLAKYPVVEHVGENEFGLGAHADTGFMTFLPPAKERGLQVLDTDGTWFWPEVPQGGIVLNIGQFLERWTNERFRATPHRVLPPRGNDRYSFACFVNTSLDTEVECLPTCTGPGNPPKYPRESYWAFYQWYMSRTYTHYGKINTGEAAE